MTPLDRVLGLLHDRGSKTKRLTPTQWEAQCPAHEDRRSSLSLSEGTDQKLLLHCHADCTVEAIVGALGITVADLFPPKPRKFTDEILTTYDYHNPEGNLIFQVIKKAGKQFRQRRPDGQNGWLWDLDGVTRVPYHLPDLIAAVSEKKAIFIPEGEKDADRLRTLGLSATTSPGGAGKWRPEYEQWFKGASHIYVLADNDQPGRNHAQDIATALTPLVEELKVVELTDLPPKGDISDWLDQNHTLDQLRQLVKDTPQWSPTQETTSLAEILDDVYDWFGRFVAYPTEHDQLAHTLWTAHTHAMDSWNSTPRIAFLSPEPASGKTRALEVTEPLVPNPVSAVNVTPAYLFRKVGEDGELPTILYDEIDTVFGPKAKDNEEIRGLLNAGHRRGAVAGRCVVIGKTVKTEEIPAYSAVALAGLGEIPDTILSRSIVIQMRRRAPGERVEPFRGRINTPQGELLRDRLGSAIGKVRTLLAEAWPPMPTGIEDRDADKWEPLLAIADAAGGEWPQKARVTVVRLVELSQDHTASLGVRLLEDIRTVFGEAEILTTEMILKGLIELDESPWGDLYGKALNARGLAQRLHKYAIPKSRTVRVGEINAKGHARTDFADAWNRYLTELVTDVTDVTPSGGSTGADEESEEPDAGAETLKNVNSSLSQDSPPQGGNVTPSQNRATNLGPPHYENVTSVTNVTNPSQKQICDACGHPIPGAHRHNCPTLEPTKPTDELPLPDPW